MNNDKAKRYYNEGYNYLQQAHTALYLFQCNKFDNNHNASTSSNNAQILHSSSFTIPNDFTYQCRSIM